MAWVGDETMAADAAAERRGAGGVEAVTDDVGSGTTAAGRHRSRLRSCRVHAFSIRLCRAEGHYLKNGTPGCRPALYKCRKEHRPTYVLWRGASHGRQSFAYRSRLPAAAPLRCRCRPAQRLGIAARLRCQQRSGCFCRRRDAACVTGLGRVPTYSRSSSGRRRCVPGDLCHPGAAGRFDTLASEHQRLAAHHRLALGRAYAQTSQTAAFPRRAKPAEHRKQVCRCGSWRR